MSNALTTLHNVSRAAQHRKIRLNAAQMRKAIALIANGVYEVSDILSEITAR